MQKDEIRPSMPTNTNRSILGASPLGLRAVAEIPGRAISEVGSGFRALLAEVAEESMIVDERSELTPAQMVESSLMARLRGASMPASHLQMRGLLRFRAEA